MIANIPTTGLIIVTTILSTACVADLPTEAVAIHEYLESRDKRFADVKIVIESKERRFDMWTHSRRVRSRPPLTKAQLTELVKKSLARAKEKSPKPLSDPITFNKHRLTAYLKGDERTFIRKSLTDAAHSNGSGVAVDGTTSQEVPGVLMVSNRGGRSRGSIKNGYESSIRDDVGSIDHAFQYLLLSLGSGLGSKLTSIDSVQEKNDIITVRGDACLWRGMNFNVTADVTQQGLIRRLDAVSRSSTQELVVELRTSGYKKFDDLPGVATSSSLRVFMRQRRVTSKPSIFDPPNQAAIKHFEDNQYHTIDVSLIKDIASYEKATSITPGPKETQKTQEN